MDFPSDLNKCRWVTDTEELEQVVKMVLQNPVRMWLQSLRIGSLVTLHSSSLMEIETNVRETMKSIPGITVNSVKVVNEVVTVQFTYRKRELEYSIVLTEYNAI